MQSERQCDYEWALSAARDLLKDLNVEVIMTDNDAALMGSVKTFFPTAHNFLCNWHIWKNIAKKHKAAFPDGDEWKAWLSRWQALLQQPTPELFDEAWAAIKADSPPRLVTYIEETWMRHRERFANAWIGQFRHLGHTVSSRVESAHARLKGYLRTSMANLLTVYELLKQADVQQTSKITIAIRNEMDQVVLNLFSRRIFKDVQGKVAHMALDMVSTYVDDFEKQDSSTVSRECTGVKSRAWGIPCRHQVYEMLRKGEFLQLDDFFKH